MMDQIKTKLVRMNEIRQEITQLIMVRFHYDSELVEYHLPSDFVGMFCGWCRMSKEDTINSLSNAYMDLMTGE